MEPIDTLSALVTVIVTSVAVLALGLWLARRSAGMYNDALGRSDGAISGLQKGRPVVMRPYLDEADGRGAG